MTALGTALGDVTEREAVKILWDTYDPWMVWYYLGAFGIAGTIGMIIFYLVTKKSVDAESDEPAAAAAASAEDDDPLA